MFPSAHAPGKLGRYEVIERLSAGGMGEVFLARFAGPGGFLKPVALKRIHPHLASDESFLHMLHDEANVTVAIKHPNVVQILEVGSEGESHYVALDYVSGETLGKLRRELNRSDTRMPLWLVVWIGAEVASALHAAHEARSLAGEPLEIIHRDVSLGNIMLADDGRPMLFDFGIAKARQRLSHTSAGELKGKIAYMAPEIFHGVPVDRTVDLFALGVVLYELLTGQAPYQRNSDLETIAAIQFGEVASPTQLRPEVDEQLNTIVLRAMARERESRYPTALQLEEDLRQWARTRGQPHDVASAQRWLQETFPARLQERQALLARVASRSSSPPHLSLSDPPGMTPEAPQTPPPTPSPFPKEEVSTTSSRLRRRWSILAGGMLVACFAILSGLLAGRQPDPTTSQLPQPESSLPHIPTASQPPPLPLSASPSASVQATSSYASTPLPVQTTERSKIKEPPPKASTTLPRRTPRLHSLELFYYYDVPLSPSQDPFPYPSFLEHLVGPVETILPGTERSSCPL
jgi:serine/threonine protein kinase